VTGIAKFSDFGPYTISSALPPPVRAVRNESSLKFPSKRSFTRAGLFLPSTASTHIPLVWGSNSILFLTPSHTHLSLIAYNSPDVGCDLKWGSPVRKITPPLSYVSLHPRRSMFYWIPLLPPTRCAGRSAPPLSQVSDEIYSGEPPAPHRPPSGESTTSALPSLRPCRLAHRQRFFFSPGLSR